MFPHYWPSKTSRFRRADDGTHGQGKKKHGRTGDDLIVKVPEGTVIKDFDGELLADLVTAGIAGLRQEEDMEVEVTPDFCPINEELPLRRTSRNR